MLISELQRIKRGVRVKDSRHGTGTVVGTALVCEIAMSRNHRRTYLLAEVKFDSGIGHYEVHNWKVDSGSLELL